MIFSSSSITAYVGVSSTYDQNKFSRGYPVSRVLIHPEYRTNAPGHADLALLQLAKPIQYVDGVQNGCLDYSESIESYYIVPGDDLSSETALRYLTDQYTEPQKTVSVFPRLRNYFHAGNRPVRQRED